MENAKIRRITIQQALSNAEFRRGFEDIAQGKGWCESWERNEQWHYERGRMFATWLTTKGHDLKSFPLKSGRWATRAAIDSYRTARLENAVF